MRSGGWKEYLHSSRRTNSRKNYITYIFQYCTTMARHCLVYPSVLFLIKKDKSSSLYTIILLYNLARSFQATLIKWLLLLLTEGWKWWAVSENKMSYRASGRITGDRKEFWSLGWKEVFPDVEGSWNKDSPCMSNLNEFRRI